MATSGFATGGVSPLGWLVAEITGGVSPVGWIADDSQGNNELGYPIELTILIDTALKDYDVLWAAAGHTHAVFPTLYSELIRFTGAKPMNVGE